MDNEPHRDMDPEARLAARIAAEPQLEFLKELRDRLPEAEWFVVGGAVRDLLLGREQGIKDYDLVVRNARLEGIERELAPRGDLDLVGRNFGVLKFQPHDAPAGLKPVDIAWPRTERAGMSGGYRDFDVQADPELPIVSDLARRDFTVNAMAWDIAGNRLVDPFGGQADLRDKVIRAVGAPADRFREDYSRMLRAIRFSCQLGFEIEPGTWEAMRSLMPHLDDQRPGPGGPERIVPYETIAKEMTKALAADAPRALELLESSGALFRLMPELTRLSGCEQSPNQHSEGDVWTHTKLSLAKLYGPEFAQFFPGQKPAVETVVATLLHDGAKPETAEKKDGIWRFFGHEEKGGQTARRVVERLKLSSDPDTGVSAERVGWLVKNHMFPNIVDLSSVRRTTLAKFFLQDPELGWSLLHLAFADAKASLDPEGKAEPENLRRLLPILDEMRPQFKEPDKPLRLITGQEVMEIAGLSSGPKVGRLLNDIVEAQLRGQISTPEEAKVMLRGLVEKK